MKHFVSASCESETCFCGVAARHKVGEEIPYDEPCEACGSTWRHRGVTGRPDNATDCVAMYHTAYGAASQRHNLTAYVCCTHFVQLFGNAAPCEHAKKKFDLERSLGLHRTPEEKLSGVPAVRLRVYDSRNDDTKCINSPTFVQHAIKIGKLASAHLRLEDPTVARMHAIIECTDQNVSIIDLGSTKGTFVNGQKVRKAPLADGSRIQIGPFKIDVDVGVIGP